VKLNNSELEDVNAETREIEIEKKDIPAIGVKKNNNVLNKKYEIEYDVDAKMKDVDIEQIKCDTVVGDGVKVNDKIEGIVSEVVSKKMIEIISKYGIPTIGKDEFGNLEVLVEFVLQR
ncbi:8083_t:CDS:2, partial [Racocetra fulgida]